MAFKMYISGGTTIVNGPTSGSNGVFDVGDSSKLTISGGTLIGAGSAGMTVSIESSIGSLTQTLNSTQSSGSAINITTDGEDMIFVPKVNWNYLYVASDNMTKGNTYSYSTISSYTGTQVFGKTENDVFYGLLTLSE